MAGSDRSVACHFAIASYLENREQVSITELLTRVFEIEPGKIDRRSQMRIANILTNLEWKKVGQKQHQGKRQVVWRRASKSTIPQLDRESIEEVLQPEPQAVPEISIPTIPSILRIKTKNSKSILDMKDRNIELLFLILR